MKNNYLTWTPEEKVKLFREVQRLIEGGMDISPLDKLWDAAQKILPAERQRAKWSNSHPCQLMNKFKEWRKAGMPEVFPVKTDKAAKRRAKQARKAVLARWKKHKKENPARTPARKSYYIPVAQRVPTLATLKFCPNCGTPPTICAKCGIDLSTIKFVPA